jgi:UDP-N-acetylmuramate: L-alanyl-gamma-D-glutamyl-meso-diaminopimelate ligase
VLTSLEFDHADIYRDFDHYRSRFVEFLQLIPPDGSLAACTDDPAVAELIAELSGNLRCSITTYGIEAENPKLHAVNLEDDGTAVSFDVLEDGKALGRVTSPSPGRHNILNALGAYVAASHVGLSFEDFAKAMATFKSVKRRQEIVAEGRGAIVIDDFAHHPTAVAATLSALRHRYPKRKLIGVFEPRSNTSRRNIYQKEFARAFDMADVSIICGVDHPEKVPLDERLDTEQLAQAISSHNGSAAYSMSGPDEIFTYLTGQLANGDLIVLMSNGGFGGLPKRFREYLKGSQ